jgi:hypothetical protein
MVITVWYRPALAAQLALPPTGDGVAQEAATVSALSCVPEVPAGMETVML